MNRFITVILDLLLLAACAFTAQLRDDVDNLAAQYTRHTAQVQQYPTLRNLEVYNDSIMHINPTFKND